MVELLISAIGGGSVALVIATFLAKSFLKIQSDKLLAKHSHALAIEKEQLGHDLAVELHQKNIRISRYESDRVEALKALYVVTVDLSAALGTMRTHVNINTAQDFRPAYFNSLKKVFHELSNIFNDIANGYRVLDINAIYIDDETENSIKKMLDDIQNYYVEALKRCQQILSEAQALEPGLNRDNQPIDLVTLWNEMIANWKALVNPSAEHLKEKIRKLLMA